MGDVYRRPNILRLPGITMRDYVPIEDVADAKLLDDMDGAAAIPSRQEASLETIPRVFTGLENDWPISTDLKCWVCDFTFDGSPKFVPLHVRESDTGSVEFGVLGNMCTFNCAEAYIETNAGGRCNSEERWRLQDNLRMLYFMFTGHRVDHIKPSPPKTELRAYGGTMDEDTYWKKMRELDPLYGLRDHTPGSILSERARAVIADCRNRDGLAPPPALHTANGAGSDSIWSVCGIPTATQADSVPIVAVSAAAIIAGAKAAGTKSSKAVISSAKPAIAAVTAKPAIAAVTAKPAVAAVTAKPAVAAVTAKPVVAAKPVAAVTAKPAVAVKPAAAAKPAATVKKVAAPPKESSAVETDISEADMNNMLAELVGLE